jgi:phage-related protein
LTGIVPLRDKSLHVETADVDGAPSIMDELRQMGETDPAAKPLKGFGGTKVMEIVDRHDKNTYRAVYTAQFEAVIYVLHAFQKKSKSGTATPQRDIELIRRRLIEGQRLNKPRSN